MKRPYAPLTKPAFIPTCFLTGILLVACFFFFFSYYDPYSACGVNLIEGGDFERNVFVSADSVQASALGSKERKGVSVALPAQWLVSGNATWNTQSGFSRTGGVRLDVTPGRTSKIEYVITDLRAWSHLRFTGRMHTANIRKGDSSWLTARLILFFRDVQGRPHWDHPHALCNCDGNKAWRRFSKVFAVPDYAVTAHVCAHNSGVSGTAWVDDLAVVPVAQKGDVLWWRLLAGILWAAVAVINIRSMRLWRRSYGPAILFVAGVIVIGVIFPQPLIDELGEKEKTWFTGGTTARPEPVQKEQPSSPRPLKIQNQKSAWQHFFEWDINAFKKAGHVMFFALLSFLAGLSYHRESYAGGVRQGAKNTPIFALADWPYLHPVKRLFFVLAPGLAIFAAATEVLQYLTDTRVPTARDWLLDLTGITLGLAVSIFTIGPAPLTRRSHFFQ